MVPPDSDRISLVPPYSGYSYVVTQFQIHDFHVLWSNFPEDSSIKLQSTSLSYNPGHAVTPPVWARPSSIASTRGFTCCFLFLRLLRCFSSPGSPRLSGSAVARTGLPHSDIPGSKVICTSPELFAACHVFLRLLKPRHPPSALVHFLCLMSFMLVGTF